MKNENPKQWLDNKIKEYRINVKNSVEMLEFLDRLDLEYPDKMKTARRYLLWLHIKMKIYYFFIFYVKNVIKIPIHIISILFVIAYVLFHIHQCRHLIKIAIEGDEQNEEIIQLVKMYIHYTDHATIIFYLTIFAWYIFS